MALPSRLLAALLSGHLLLLSACREAVETFEPGQLTRGETGRLTFSASDDRSPVWTPSGDAVVYSTNGLAGVDSGPGVLIRVSVTSGHARAVLPAIQSPSVVGEHWLLAPTPRPDGEAIAFAEITATWLPHPCDLTFGLGLSCTPARTPEEVEQPPLQLIAIHARELEAKGPLNNNPSFEFRAAGTQLIVGAPKVSIVTDHPYQQLFARDRAVTFRPSWSPDGTRLAFSDGLHLLIWVVGSGPPQAVPNTQDGVWPAWSPDGEWIAFTRLERADSTSVLCDYIALTEVHATSSASSTPSAGTYSASYAPTAASCGSWPKGMSLRGGRTARPSTSPLRTASCRCQSATEPRRRSPGPRTAASPPSRRTVASWPSRSWRARITTSGWRG